MNDFFELGRVLKPHGIKGGIKAELYTDNIKRVYDLGFVFFNENSKMIKRNIISVTEDGNFAYFYFDYVNSRNDAELLRNRLFYIDREHAAPLEEGHFYICDLIGLRVSDSSNNEIGIVRNVIQNGCADVYELMTIRGDVVYFAAAPGVITECNLKDGYILVDSEKLSEVMC